MNEDLTPDCFYFIGISFNSSGSIELHYNLPYSRSYTAYFMSLMYFIIIMFFFLNGFI